MPLEKLGPYKLEKLLGRGGMGAVYIARHEVTGERAAVKLLAGHLADDPSFRERFKQDIGLYAPYFYDSVMVLAAAMQKAGSSVPAGYLPELRRIRHAGVTADIEFDAHGDLKSGLLSIFRVQGGTWALQ